MRDRESERETEKGVRLSEPYIQLDMIDMMSREVGMHVLV